MSDHKKTHENTSQCLGNIHKGTDEKQNKRARRWTFVLNNWTEKEYDEVMDWLKHKEHTIYIVGKEISKEENEKGELTPHLQGFFKSKNAVSFKTLKNLNNRFYLDKAKGTDEENYRYCSKEGNYETNMVIDNIRKLLMSYDKVKWREWQQKIIDIIENKPDNRTVNFIVDTRGNNGKSFLCKYIYLKYGCIIADGKKDNVFNQILTATNNDEPIKIVILDIPRHNLNYLNYGCIEQIKDGLIYSGKYEGGICCFPSPHIFVFMNEYPDTDKFTSDRYNIIELDGFEII